MFMTGPNCRVIVGEVYHVLNRGNGREGNEDEETRAPLVLPFFPPSRFAVTDQLATPSLRSLLRVMFMKHFGGQGFSRTAGCLGLLAR